MLVPQFYESVYGRYHNSYAHASNFLISIVLERDVGDRSFKFSEQKIISLL